MNAPRTLGPRRTHSENAQDETRTRKGRSPADFESVHSEEQWLTMVADATANNPDVCCGVRSSVTLARIAVVRCSQVFRDGSGTVRAQLGHNWLANPPTDCGAAARRSLTAGMPNCGTVGCLRRCKRRQALDRILPARCPLNSLRMSSSRSGTPRSQSSNRRV